MQAQKMQIQPQNNVSQQQQMKNYNQNNNIEVQNQDQANNQEEQIHYEQLNEMQYEQYVQNLQLTNQKIVQKIIGQSNNGPQEQQEQIIEPVKNPVSAYLIFTMKWKADNPNAKFSMSHLGQLWKNLDSNEKRLFQVQYKKRKEKYDLYVASRLIKNPNPDKDTQIENKFFFPLHRIKAIMKQDKYYAPKTQAVTTMARATEYFGEYILQELKKTTQGKNRIDTKDLFQCISVNQGTFGFLQCLIDDYNQSSKELKNQGSAMKNLHTTIMNNDNQMNQNFQQDQIQKGFLEKNFKKNNFQKKNPPTAVKSAKKYNIFEQIQGKPKQTTLIGFVTKKN